MFCCDFYPNNSCHFRIIELNGMQIKALLLLNISISTMEVRKCSLSFLLELEPYLILRIYGRNSKYEHKHNRVKIRFVVYLNEQIIKNMVKKVSKNKWNKEKKTYIEKDTCVIF